jgi:cytochrome c peroxidase
MQARSIKRGPLAGALGALPALFMLADAALAADVAQLTPQEKAVVLSLSPLPPPPHDPTNAVSGNCRAIDFGRNLFFDFRLSSNIDRSCATCHIPESGFADGRAVVNPSGALRNTPSLWNAVYNHSFFWGGRSDSLWAQATGPIEGPTEQNLNRLDLAYRILSERDLRTEYEALFGPLPDLARRAAMRAGLSEKDRKTLWKETSLDARNAITRILVNIGKAIAAFEETITSRDSAFDKYVQAIRSGNKAASTALSPEAQRGLKIFAGRGQCFQCHSGPAFSDGKFHNMLVAADKSSPEDLGRYRGLELLDASDLRRDGPFSSNRKATGVADQKPAATGAVTRGQFKTPPLRNVTEKSAFMHNGQILSLKGVVAHYASLRMRSRRHPEADPVLSSIDVRIQDTDDLIAFLRSLKDTSKLDTLWDDCVAGSGRPNTVADYNRQ